MADDREQRQDTSIPDAPESKPVGLLESIVVVVAVVLAGTVGWWLFRQ
jgi:hypothetical protein